MWRRGICEKKMRKITADLSSAVAGGSVLQSREIFHDYLQNLYIRNNIKA
jgi:hypothetical protein